MLDREDDAGPVFRALAEENRRRILERLGRGPATVTDLAAPLSITLAATVQHVQTLEGAGLVTTTKTGRTRSCRLVPDGLAPAEAWIAARKRLWERRLDRLGDVLGADNTTPEE